MLLGASRPPGLLARLLGPAGEQLTCDACFDQLDRFVELDLSGAEADAESMPPPG